MKMKLRILCLREVQNSIEERVAASSQAPAEQSLPQQEIMSINTAMPQGTPSTKTYKRGADQVLVDTYGNGTIIAIYPQNRTTFLDGKAKPVGLVKRMVNPDKSIANFYVDGTIKTTPAPSN